MDNFDLVNVTMPEPILYYLLNEEEEVVGIIQENNIATHVKKEHNIFENIQPQEFLTVDLSSGNEEYILPTKFIRSVETSAKKEEDPVKVECLVQIDENPGLLYSEADNCLISEDPHGNVIEIEEDVEIPEMPATEFQLPSCDITSGVTNSLKESALEKPAEKTNIYPQRGIKLQCDICLKEFSFAKDFVMHGDFHRGERNAEKRQKLLTRKREGSLVVPEVLKNRYSPPSTIRRSMEQASQSLMKQFSQYSQVRRRSIKNIQPNLALKQEVPDVLKNRYSYSEEASTIQKNLGQASKPLIPEVLKNRYSHLKEPSIRCENVNLVSKSVMKQDYHFTNHRVTVGDLIVESKQHSNNSPVHNILLPNPQNNHSLGFTNSFELPRKVHIQQGIKLQCDICFEEFDKERDFVWHCYKHTQDRFLHGAPISKTLKSDAWYQQ